MNNTDKTLVTLSEEECRNLYGGLPILVPVITLIGATIGVIASGVHMANAITSRK